FGAVRLPAGARRHRPAAVHDLRRRPCQLGRPGIRRRGRLLRRRLRLRLTAVTLPAGRYYDSLAASPAALAALVAGTDPALPVPACPDLEMLMLVTHHGRAHPGADGQHR